MSRTAHPRSRGENLGDDGARWGEPGSSPLARGKPPVLTSPTHHRRLIPARAGKTLYVTGKGGKTRAHPRSRGENLPDAHADSAYDGSSPLARGKHQPQGFSLSVRGLIPARAGKTRPGGCRALGTRAHPRSRGENEEYCPEDRSACGSSPLARGKRGRGPPPGRSSRLIPARAGKTPVAIHLPKAGGGSSPLARGKRICCTFVGGQGGLIPARAGKTACAWRLTA